MPNLLPIICHRDRTSYFYCENSFINSLVENSKSRLSYHSLLCKTKGKIKIFSTCSILKDLTLFNLLSWHKSQNSCFINLNCLKAGSFFDSRMTLWMITLWRSSSWRKSPANERRMSFLHGRHTSHDWLFKNELAL